MISAWASTVGLSTRTIAPYSPSVWEGVVCSTLKTDRPEARNTIIPRTIGAAIYNNIFSMEKLKVRVVDTTSEPTKIESKEPVQGPYLLFLFCVAIPHLLVNERGWNRLYNKYEDTPITSIAHYQYQS